MEVQHGTPGGGTEDLRRKQESEFIAFYFLGCNICWFNRFVFVGVEANIAWW
ncbi:hypothetical protein COCNU_contig69258930G000010 [Cocos nucifera]|nr:hypothetical protein [Cocos nucifera]